MHTCVWESCYIHLTTDRHIPIFKLSNSLVEMHVCNTFVEQLLTTYILSISQQPLRGKNKFNTKDPRMQKMPKYSRNQYAVAYERRSRVTPVPSISKS